MNRTRIATVVGSTVLLAGCYAGARLEVAGDTDSAGESSADESSGSTGDSDGGEPGAPVECDGQVLDPGPNLVRRLTVNEYVNTVEAVFGVDVRADAEARLPADLRADGFTNTTSGLITTLAHIEAYEALAEIIVGRIPDLPGFVATYATCQEYEESCKREYVERLGLRVFRRPLRSNEIDPLAAAFDIAEEEGQSFDVGAGLVLEAMVQSPAFLYRLEGEVTGDRVRALDGYEMASRLSYLLWSGPPDDALLDAAAGDRLRTDGEIEEAVERMLADPRARQASLGFVRDWLNLGRLDNLPRDPDWFPDWSLAIAADMVQ
jgi:hypothetical protein